jgi:hypothetical protein
LFAVWRSILTVDGSNQYKAPHSGVRKRAKNATTGVDLIINVDEYNRVSELVNALPLI